MVPAWLVSTSGFGIANWGWLNTLNASARNCISSDSRNLKSLKMEVSTLYCAGPRSVPTPASPKLVAKVCPGARLGIGEAPGVNQHKRDCCPEHEPPVALVKL